jgi:integrase
MAKINVWFDEVERKDGGTSHKAFIRYDPKKPTLTKTCRQRSDLLRWVGEQLEALEDGTWDDPVKRKRPLEYYAGVWWQVKEATLRPTTLRPYRRWMDLHILPCFGKDRVGDITESDVEVFLAKKAARYAPKSVNEILNVLDGILEQARKDKAIRDNPCDGKRYTVEDYDGPALTMEQVIDFVSYVSPWYRPAVLLIVFTGVRSGEAWGLHINDLDWSTGQLRVRRTYGGKDEEGPVKTKAGKRDTPNVPDFVMDQLRARIEARGLGLDSDSPLFLNRHGLQVKRDTFQKRIIIPAAAKAGLPKGFRTHDLRASHVSLLLDLGANIKAISRSVGHTNEGFTLRKYARPLPGATEKLSAIITESYREALKARDDAVPLHAQVEKSSRKSSRPI